MSGIYIPGMEIPNPSLDGMAKVIDAYILLRPNRNAVIVVDNEDSTDSKEYQIIPVPDHGRILKVLKTERECVSRDCDRNCGKCDLALGQSEILSVYDTLILTFSDPADKEGDNADN